MRDKPVPADELEDAKRAIVAGFALSLESPQRMLGYYTESWTYGLPADYWDTYPARISAVTAAEAQAAAQEVLGSVAPADRRGGRRDEDRRGSDEEGSARGLRRGRQSSEVGPAAGLSDRPAAQWTARSLCAFLHDLFHRRGERVDLLERRVDVRRHAHALVLRVHDRRGDDPPAGPTAARRPSRVGTPVDLHGADRAGLRRIEVRVDAERGPASSSRVAQRSRR